MKNIDDYIELAATMKNTSDGGSEAYHFDDVVLVKYYFRECEESVAQRVNEKNARGVRTPAHLAIKRVKDGDAEICWVLQERAKGLIYKEYCRNEDPKKQLEMQLRIVNAPAAHYEKLVKDFCELFDLGWELKSKNVFYDEDIQNGGFTIIDFLEGSHKPFDYNSRKDILEILPNMGGICYAGQLNFNNDASEEDKKLATQQSYKIKQNFFSAMEKTIPNFENHRRWVLRSMSDSELAFFEKNGTFIGDLRLNEQEYQEFDQTIETIINNSIEGIVSGENEYWEIGMNEIRINANRFGLKDAWFYHSANNRRKSDFDGDFADLNYRSTCEEDLKENINAIFDERLSALAKDSTNPFVLKAKEDLDEKLSRETNNSRSL